MGRAAVVLVDPARGLEGFAGVIVATKEKEGVMQNTYSAFAQRIMSEALAGGVTVPAHLRVFVTEMLKVPEAPSTLTFTVDDAASAEVVIPVTGGLDSTVLYWRSMLAEEDPFAYYVRFGHKYTRKELKALDALGIDYHILEAGVVANETSYWQHIIPGRNFLILSLLAEHMDYGGVIRFGAVEGEIPKSGGDKSVAFIAEVNRLFADLPYPVHVEVPLKKETKADLVAWWLENNLKVELLENTVSCFNAGAGHCGACQACLRKWLAFDYNGLTLKTHTPVSKGCVPYINKYRTLMAQALRENDYSRYSEKRCRQDMTSLEKL